ncbi:MAG: transcription repressor NadR [Tissierellia bacterium]|nr:transcription repressor NadR [Tissierellia bacterium]
MSASTLAKKFNVSRQVIVGDIALMRALGLKISATPRGYVIDKSHEDNLIFTIACKHNKENMGKELYAVVDNGGAVLDVTVEHGVYGQIIGELRIFSRYDVDLFLEKIEKYKSLPLSNLTGGIHLHRIQCKDEESYKRITQVLCKENILLKDK